MDAIFRVRLADGHIGLARGEATRGPGTMLPAGTTVADLLAGDGSSFLRATRQPTTADRVPHDAIVLAPVDRQEVWAAGVTYRRSRDARKEESVVADVYDRVYDADRPELFYKAAGWRVRGPGETVAIRADSAWDVPEPELALVVAANGAIVGLTIGNDMSSRSIEGDNPLYLPQAKVYDQSCALGPSLVPIAAVTWPLRIDLSIRRDDAVVVQASTTTAEIARPFEVLVEHLTRALSLPDGAVLLTGTGVVPDPEFTLRHGDHVRIEIAGLGSLSNDVVTVGRTSPPIEASNRG